MTEKEAQKVLDELNTVRIEVLNGEAKRLFGAIMKIADERNFLQLEKEKQKEQIDYLRRSCDRKEECLIKEQQENARLKNKLKEKEKIIDDMADWLYGDDTSFGYGKLKEVNTKERIVKFFENKIEQK